MKLVLPLFLYSMLFIPQLRGLSLEQQSFTPTAFEGQFEEISDALLFTIHPKMTVIYSKNLGALVSVWAGPPDKTGLSKSMFYPSQNIYHRKYDTRVWALIKDGKELIPNPQFISFSNSPEETVFKYQLIYQGIPAILVSEFSSYDAHYGAPSVFFSFEFSKFPENVQVKLRLSGPVNKEEWSAGGGSVQIIQEDKNNFALFPTGGKHRVKAVWEP